MTSLEKYQQKIQNYADKIDALFEWESEDDRKEWFGLLGLLVPETDKNCIS